MEQQQHGFSDSTPRAGSDRLQKSSKSFSYCITMYVHKSITPKSMGPVISTLFKSQEKFVLIGGRLRNNSDQSEFVLRIFKLYFCTFQKNEISFSNFFFRFCNHLLSKQLFFNK